MNRLEIINRNQIPLRSFFFAFLFFGTISLAVSCQDQVDWVTYRGLKGAGYTSESIHPPLGVLWKLHLQDLEEQATSFNPPIIQGDNIYFGSNDRNFYSVDIRTGYMNWIFKTKAAVNSVPFADEDRIYFGSNDGYVYAVDRKTGQEIWSYNTGKPVQSLILRYEDTIIFTSDTGATHFLDLDGKLKNTIPNPVWSHHTFQVYDGIVYWAPRGRNFGAYDINNRRFLWTVNVNVPYAAWYSFPAIDDKYVYYSSSYLGNRSADLRYYALDRKTGELIWVVNGIQDLGQRTPMNSFTAFMRHIDLLDYMAPSLWKDLVIYSSGDTKVRAFKAATGELAWEKQFEFTTSSALTVAGDRVYFGVRGDEFNISGFLGKSVGTKPKLVCLSAKNGKLLWEMEVDGAVLSAPVISGNRILFGTDTHQFYVLEELF